MIAFGRADVVPRPMRHVVTAAVDLRVVIVVIAAAVPHHCLRHFGCQRCLLSFLCHRRRRLCCHRHRHCKHALLQSLWNWHTYYFVTIMAAMPPPFLNRIKAPEDRPVLHYGM